ncbi:MAG: hypothetical protein KF799_14300 [Bdellovibrionales bacterium]|nr:hypothetical protein [Bdellovibrionales bacterium]
MARLAVLTDRLPGDASWKGAYTWEIIRSLCESQHEVTVFTTENPEHIPLTHSRLTVARPARSFSADKLPRWTQALLVYRPEVIHTFPLQNTAHWPSLTVWPYLDAVCKVLPQTKRVSTMFDREDFVTAPAWHAGADGWTVFSNELESEARRVYQGRIDVVPLEEMSWSSADNSPEGFEERDYVFIPAPVSEWHHRQHALSILADHLIHHPETCVYINGGWGDLSLSERRRGWSQLSHVASRVRLMEAQPLPKFVARARVASHLWLEGIAPNSWRYMLSRQVAQTLGKEMIGSANDSALPSGSTANFLSRLYLS